MQAMLRMKLKNEKDNRRCNDGSNSKSRAAVSNSDDAKDKGDEWTKEDVAWGLVSDAELDDDWTADVHLESDSDTADLGKAAPRRLTLPIVIEDSEDEATV